MQLQYRTMCLVQAGNGVYCSDPAGSPRPDRRNQRQTTRQSAIWLGVEIGAQRTTKPLFQARMTPAVADILTREDVAAWLKVEPRQVERLGVPCLLLGRKTLRYLRSDVLAWLEAQRAPTSRRAGRAG